jgi:peptidylprolyl isomerase
MSKMQQTRRDARRAARARQKLITQIVGIIIVVLVVGLIALGIYNNTRKGQNAITPTAPVVATPTISFPTPGGPTPQLIGTKQYSNGPTFSLDVTKQYYATIKMAKGGEFVIQLFPDKAPITVNSFIFLARQGFFNGVTFHRVISGFMAQGGDPTGTGSGGPGYKFVNEKNDLAFDKAGVVAMANSGPDTNGSQFFITFGAVNLTEADYTIFGQVTSGMDVVNAITLRDPTQNPTFTGDAIDTVVISER